MAQGPISGPRMLGEKFILGPESDVANAHFRRISCSGWRVGMGTRAETAESVLANMGTRAPTEAERWGDPDQVWSHQAEAP